MAQAVVESKRRAELEIEARIRRHPVLPPLPDSWVKFSFNGREMVGRTGEMVSSAVFAGGEHIFGHHNKDGGAQGIFCANGQCSQCTLIINGVPLKSCIVPLEDGMVVQSVEGLPSLEDIDAPSVKPPEDIETDVLIIGAGPSGMAAARELGASGFNVILVDDKDRLGGKLVLQTHKFFGSEEDCRAGIRGTKIAGILAGELQEFPCIDIWMESIVLAVFSDGTIGVRKPDGYKIVKPRQLLVAAGAREKSLPFPGCTIPGVYGAGAFQTLVNRDQIRCSERLFVLGGGNVGLIGAYHALQAGMTVVGLAEGMERCGGYKVHADKILRMGVPIYTRHTVLAAHGDENLESVTIAAVDENFKLIPGTERNFKVDTLLVAVGLSSVNEFHSKAVEYGIPSMLTGDSEEIAEASAAMFSGRICGRKIAFSLRGESVEIPADWLDKAEILKSPGGSVEEYTDSTIKTGVFPVIHCFQEIPCNPCMTVCPKELITTDGHPIQGLPKYSDSCIGCRKCVAVCPGLAITLVDYRKNSEFPTVTIPWELGDWVLKKDQTVVVTEWEGKLIGSGTVLRLRNAPGYPSTMFLDIMVSENIANRVAGVRVQNPEVTIPAERIPELPIADDAIVCRCERVTAGEIRELIREGVRDMNELKARSRAGFGACGGKTCKTLIPRILRDEGISAEEITDFTERPLFAETRLGIFCGKEHK
ncbi:MAG: FAD-dependent oxidoreductase [Candidatus Sabulitectum sp.]|nr:FAD-dependent oxidoreductase [Candidatus Sabulitectum sp.]